MIFREPITTNFEVKMRSEKEAYVMICVNEILNTLGLISANDYATNYAIISDNDQFKLF